METLIHIATRPDLSKIPESSVKSETMENLYDDGIIEKTGDSGQWYLTDLGNMWFNEILRTPIPTIKYFGANGIQLVK